MFAGQRATGEASSVIPRPLPPTLTFANHNPQMLEQIDAVPNASAISATDANGRAATVTASSSALSSLSLSSSSSYPAPTAPTHQPQGNPDPSTAAAVAASMHRRMSDGLRILAGVATPDSNDHDGRTHHHDRVDQHHSYLRQHHASPATVGHVMSLSNLLASEDR
ncbi:hypothetical protein HDU83_000725 [Entophlyctis luteolus]|nr:hypothetical protein HDU83_000725 [Entophlyctis luteolus]